MEFGSYSFDFVDSGSSSSSFIGGGDGDSRSYTFDYFFDQVAVDDDAYGTDSSTTVTFNSSTSSLSSTSSTDRESDRFVVTLFEIEDVVC